MLKYLKMFMPDGDGIEPGGMGGSAAMPGGTPADTVPQPIEGVNDPNGEGTTPEEIAKILGGKAGSSVTPAAAAASEDEDENNGANANANGAPAGESGTPAPANGEGSPATPAAATATAEPATPPAAAAEPATPATPVAPPDFSLTVEDKDGVSFKIEPGDDLEEVLKEFNPTGTGQLMDIMRKLCR
jgi:hypothetical protein